MRDELGLIQSAAITEQLANSVPDNGGVYFVPALTGLGAPYWDQYARGVIIGITRGTSTAHLTRAALEGICYQVYDVLMAMENDIHAKPKEIRVDGGAIANNFLMQFQADICRCPVVRPRVLETTALGAAYLAGLAIGYWKDVDELKEQWSLDNIFSAEMHEETAETLLTEWHKAVGRFHCLHRHRNRNWNGFNKTISSLLYRMTTGWLHWWNSCQAYSLKRKYPIRLSLNSTSVILSTWRK